MTNIKLLEKRVNKVLPKKNTMSTVEFIVRRDDGKVYDKNGQVLDMSKYKTTNGLVYYRIDEEE